VSLRRRFLLVAVLLAGTAPVVARASPDAPPACTSDLGRRAQEALDGVDTWPAFHGYYRRFGGCQDGAVGEGASDLTERLLLDQWDRLPVLVSLAKADPAFRRFVLGQFGEVTTMSAAAQITANAKERCPSEAKALCADLVRALR
jgi:hypothetical protein